jgi:Putative mono-oxygenase ydhR
VPGLSAKLWLADRDANTYGGVYLFSDAHAQAAFAGSDLFVAVGSPPAMPRAAA